MILRALKWSVPVLLLTVICGPLVLGDDSGDKDKSVDRQEIANRWIAAGMPGDEHQRLQHFVGEWETLARYYPSPGADPVESQGSSKIESIISGRFVREHLDSKFMGFPFIGNGMFGFDNFKQDYVATWVDSLHTSVYYSECVVDEPGALYTCMGSYDDAGTGERDKMVKYTIRIVNPDKHVIENYNLGFGETETKVMEMTFTRKNGNRHAER